MRTITLRSKYQKWLPSFWLGRKCAYCGKRKGKRGRGAAGKSVVLGLLERQGQVYTRVVDSITAEQLLQVIKAKTISKEMEYRYNHRRDNILEPIMKLYFGYVSY